MLQRWAIWIVAWFATLLVLRGIRGLHVLLWLVLPDGRVKRLLLTDWYRWRRRLR